MMVMSKLIPGFCEPKSPTDVAQHPKSPPSTWSPSITRRFPNSILIPTAPKKMVMEFGTQDETIGRITIKILEGTGELGPEFESLVMGSRGYGYQGTRVYACCRNEWCLIGDVLYRGAQEEALDDEDDGEDTRKADPPTVYRGYKGVTENSECPQQDVIGSVVLIGSDLDIETNTWKLGPQFKICLSESLIKSGRVVGQVIDGIEVAHNVSQLFEDSPRITVSYCGSL